MCRCTICKYLFQTCPQLHNSSRFETILKTWSQLEEVPIPSVGVQRFSRFIEAGTLEANHGKMRVSVSMRVEYVSFYPILSYPALSYPICRITRMNDWLPCGGEFVVARVLQAKRLAPTPPNDFGILWSQGQQSQSRFKTPGSLQGFGQIHGPAPVGACDQSLQQGICKPWWLQICGCLELDSIFPQICCLHFTFHKLLFFSLFRVYFFFGARGNWTCWV